MHRGRRVGVARRLEGDASQRRTVLRVKVCGAALDAPMHAAVVAVVRRAVDAGEPLAPPYRRADRQVGCGRLERRGERAMPHADHGLAGDRAGEADHPIVRGGQGGAGRRAKIDATVSGQPRLRGAVEGAQQGRRADRPVHCGAASATRGIRRCVGHDPRGSGVVGCYAVSMRCGADEHKQQHRCQRRRCQQRQRCGGQQPTVAHVVAFALLPLAHPPASHPSAVVFPVH